MRTAGGGWGGRLNVFGTTVALPLPPKQPETKEIGQNQMTVGRAYERTEYEMEGKRTSEKGTEKTANHQT